MIDVKIQTNKHEEELMKLDLENKIKKNNNMIKQKKLNIEKNQKKNKI